MFFGLFGRKTDPATDAVYASIVAQARQPVFYVAFQVPDTVTGRFDMILAHVVAYCARFRADTGPASGKVQALVDRFFTDMDDSMREMGISDTRVPGKMKQLASAYAGRTEAYGPALAAGDTAVLAAALARNVYAGVAGAVAPEALARYLVAVRDALAAAGEVDLFAGRIPWPDGQVFAPAAPADPIAPEG